MMYVYELKNLDTQEVKLAKSQTRYGMFDTVKWGFNEAGKTQIWLVIGEYVKK